jgi:4-hydroxyproline epimerase
MTPGVHVIDSHTAGEPTRVVIEGGPELGAGTIAEKRDLFATKHDQFRAGVVNEPRGSDVLVGALLLPPADPRAIAAVLFFNNVGCLQMCGHGMIGVITTLAHLGRIKPGAHRLETPAGVVTATLHEDGSVSIENVPSWRAARKYVVATHDYGKVAGDIAWGGNWFFLVDLESVAMPAAASREIARAQIPQLAQLALSIKEGLQAISTQLGSHVIDHIEICAPSRERGIDSCNFVLCPGNAYDRSPCGTGTSAKLACLAADDLLGENEAWVQQGVIGSTFTARYRWLDQEKGIIIPTITGRAHVTSDATLLFDPADPFCWGIS